MPIDSQPIELFHSRACRFVLTRDPDSLLANIDRGTALVWLMAKGMVGQRGAAEFPVAIEAKIEEIKAERRKKAGSWAVLVVEAQGEIDAMIKEPLREHNEFVVMFDAIDKRAVRQVHQSEIEAMKLAVAFESEAPSRFAALSEGTYLINESGKTVYSISFSAFGEARLSTGQSLQSRCASVLQT